VPEKALFLWNESRDIMKIGIGTTNKAKCSAVRQECGKHFEKSTFQEYQVSSGVSDQPIGDNETLTGAKNRALNVLKLSGADIAFGLEGGVKEQEDAMFICNWGVLATKEGHVFVAGGAQIPLPEEIAKPIRDGSELGPIMDDFTKREGTRHTEGAVGVFTNGLVNRSDMFEHIIRLLIGQYMLASSTFKNT
jgi:inosine/xanthosine triphosphatase